MYGFSHEQIHSHIASLLTVRYPNKNLDDYLARVARDPERKLGRSERLVGAALKCLACGVVPKALVETIVAAFRCENPSDAAATAFRARVQVCPPEEILHDVCGLLPEESLEWIRFQILTTSGPLFRDILRRQVQHLREVVVGLEDWLGLSDFSELAVNALGGIGRIRSGISPRYLK